MGKQYTDLMVDIETLGLTPDAKILSISAVAFNPFDENPDYLQYPTFDCLVDVDSQETRTVDLSTVDWWSQQEEEVKEKIFSETGRISLQDALSQFALFARNRKRIWAQGVTVDITILSHAMRQHDIPLPWLYFAVSDSRSILDLVEVDSIPATHDSILDCFRQVMNLQQAFKKLGIKKFVRTK